MIKILIIIFGLLFMECTERIWLETGKEIATEAIHPSYIQHFPVVKYTYTDRDVEEFVSFNGSMSDVQYRYRGISIIEYPNSGGYHAIMLGDTKMGIVPYDKSGKREEVFKMIYDVNLYK